MRLSSPIYKLKRRAKHLARNSQIPLHEALNTVAKTEGFRGWSHLAYQHSKTTPATGILRQLRPGDMVLIAARAGQGKTLLGIELAALAPKAKRQGYFYTLDYTKPDVRNHLETLGFDPTVSAQSVVVDTSDNICATYIIDSLAGAAKHALIVVDYLQILDQRRSTPALGEQIEMLKTFATDHGAIIVMISQIDRSFDLSAKAIPGLEDIRLPNQVDLSLFEKRCFLHGGAIQVESAA